MLLLGTRHQESADACWQENIIRARTQNPIKHPLVSKLFTEFRNGAYKPSEQLAADCKLNPMQPADEP